MIDKSKFLYLDFETTLEGTIRKPLVVSLYQEGWEDAKIEILPDLNTLYNKIKGCKLVCHNTPFDISVFALQWQRGDIELHDTLALARLLLPKLPEHSLGYLFKHFKIPYNNSKDNATEFGKLYKKLSKKLKGRELADVFKAELEKQKELLEYAKLDTKLLVQVHKKLLALLPKNNKGNPKYPFHYRLDMQVLDIWNESIRLGVPIEIEVTKSLVKEKQVIMDSWSYDFNYNSPKQAKEFLAQRDLTIHPIYVDFIAWSIDKSLSYKGKAVKQSELRRTLLAIPKLREIVARDSKKHAKFTELVNMYSKLDSTNSVYLLAFRGDEVVDKLVEIKSTRKLLNDYLEKFLKKPDARFRGRLEPTTNTGRARSKEENIQNIPRAYKKCVGYSKDADKLILSADFSQLELRTIAAITRDKRMTQVFREYKDIHGITAEGVFGKNYTPEQRTYGKAVTFGTLYGGSARVAWEMLVKAGIYTFTVAQVQEMQDKWKKTYSGVAKWQEEGKKAIYESKGFKLPLKNGKLQTYYLTKIAGNRLAKVTKLNDYLNFENQGAGALVAKLANHYLFKLINAEVEAGKLSKDEVKFLNFVHDDIWLELPYTEDLEKLKYYSNLVTSSYQKAWRQFGKLVKGANNIPMPVEVEIGYTLKDTIFVYEDRDKEFWNKVSKDSYISYKYLKD